MNHLIPTLFKLVVSTALLGCTGCTQAGLAIGESSRQATPAMVDGSTNVSAVTSEQRRLMSQGERLRWLERSGIVPEDADDIDWQLAPRTSWWGNPIDPTSFWADRVVWLSVSARKAARQRGRFYPPIPDGDKGMADRSTDDIGAVSVGVAGPYCNYRQSEREAAFWNYFAKTHLKPPEEIEREQRDAAKDFYGTHTLTGLSFKDMEDLKVSLRHRPLSKKYPAEAFAEEALFYSVTPPLTAAQVKLANGWKISYLQRLRREQVDESYLDAYLKAWNLTPAQVFVTD